MAKFLTELVAKKIDRKFWELTAPLVYDSDLLGLTMTIDTGFKTDFASIPRAPLAYWLVGGMAEASATVHDKLYQIQTCTRKEADDVMLEAMKAEGIERWRRNLIYAGVRAGGWYTWWKYARRLKKRK